MGRWRDRLATVEVRQLPAREAILAALAGGERLTARALAFRLGVHRDTIYPVLGELLDARAIGTDPKTATYFRPEAA